MMKSVSISSDYDKTGLGWKILICCILFIGVGLINSLWTHSDYQAWYERLRKPVFSPPSSSMVGLIWTVMYISMGISVGIVWQISKKSTSRKISKSAKRGIRLFLVQLLVNMIVPVFFFAFNNLFLLLIAVTLNFILMVILIAIFYGISKVTTYILVPYLIWLLYAIILDGSLLMLN